jgi:tetratricopeptide (TPR) repeat protein
MRRALAIIILLTGAAQAEMSLDLRLYAEGNYDDAIRAGLSRGDARGYAEAARAQLAQEVSGDEPCLPCLEKAEDYARRAIAADPKLPEGQVYLAISLGMEEHLRGTSTALRLKYPSEAKHALDAALAVDPKNPWALAALGGWNLAIVHGGGSFLADLFYGATVKRGLEAFAAAFKSAPDNILLRYQYALSLSVFDPDRFHTEIEDALVHATGAPANTAYEKLIQKRVVDLLDLFRKGDQKAYLARVRKYEGYP